MQAREIIYDQLNVDTQNCAKLFIIMELIRQCGSNAILATIPAKLAEGRLRGEESDSNGR